MEELVLGRAFGWIWCKATGEGERGSVTVCAGGEAAPLVYLEVTGPPSLAAPKMLVWTDR